MAAKKNSKKPIPKKAAPAAKKSVKPTTKGKPASKSVPKKKEQTKKKERVYKINKGLRLWNSLQKQFKVLNSKLPKEKQLPFTVRRKILSEQVYKHFKNAPKGLKNIKAYQQYIQHIIDSTNVRLFDSRVLFENFDKELNSVPWFAIDGWIVNLPSIYDVRINAGDFGITNIFNSEDYDYGESGVRDIVENIRGVISDERVSNESGYAEFNGIILVKANRKDDGNTSSYFIDMRLTINGVEEYSETEDESEPEKFTPTGKREENKTEKVKKKIAEEIAKLTVKKYPKGKVKRVVKTKKVPPKKRTKEQIKKAESKKKFDELRHEVFQLYYKGHNERMIKKKDYAKYVAEIYAIKNDREGKARFVEMKKSMQQIKKIKQLEKENKALKAKLAPKKAVKKVTPKKRKK